jgi:hypothetical protein
LPRLIEQDVSRDEKSAKDFISHLQEFSGIDNFAHIVSSALKFPAAARVFMEQQEIYAELLGKNMPSLVKEAEEHILKDDQKKFRENCIKNPDMVLQIIANPAATFEKWGHTFIDEILHTALDYSFGGIPIAIAILDSDKDVWGQYYEKLAAKAAVKISANFAKPESHAVFLRNFTKFPPKEIVNIISTYHDIADQFLTADNISLLKIKLDEKDFRDLVSGFPINLIIQTHWLTEYLSKEENREKIFNGIKIGIIDLGRLLGQKEAFLKIVAARHYTHALTLAVRSKEDAVMLQEKLNSGQLGELSPQQQERLQAHCAKYAQKKAA